MDLTHQRRSNLSPEDFAPSSSHGHERHGHERKGTRSRVPQPAHPTTVLKAPTARPIPAWGVAPCTAAPQTRGLKTRAILAWAEGPGATTPHIRGLKARATLAWGNAPGTAAPQTCGLKARAKRTPRHESAARLIPHELLIEFHPILLKHRPHLRLEVAPLVMRGLRIDIPHQRRSITRPNGERRIASLPAKSRKLRPFRLDPLRRRNLHPLHDFRHRLGACKQQPNVNVVGNSANPNADVLRMIENRSQIRMHLASDRITQKRPPLLRAEDQMHQHIRERLRHAHEYSARPSYVEANNSSATNDPAPTARPIQAWGNAPGTAEPQTCGLKARATLAWGNTPGTAEPQTCGLKVRAIDSSIQSVSAPGSALHEMVRRPAANPLIELPEAE